MTAEKKLKKRLDMPWKRGMLGWTWLAGLIARLLKSPGNRQNKRSASGRRWLENGNKYHAKATSR